MIDPQPIDPYSLIPPFGHRLHQALQAAGMEPPQLIRELRAYGITRTPGHVYNILNGLRPNPTLLTVAGCIKATDADPRWFFSRDLPEGHTPQDVLWRDLS